MKKENRRPISRHSALQSLSRDHHHGLLLCWKIRTGFSKNVHPQRIKKYADWFYNRYLVPHFELEEVHIFPILIHDNEKVIRALAEHRRLHRLFSNTVDIKKSLSRIEEELEQHIRYEERVLFNGIQQIATEEQLKSISKIHKDEKFTDNTDDAFWT